MLSQARQPQFDVSRRAGGGGGIRVEPFHDKKKACAAVVGEGKSACCVTSDLGYEKDGSWRKTVNTIAS